MAGDTLRGIGKKELAEALETPSESSSEPENSGQTREAAGDIDIEEARPVRSLDDLPSDRTGRPGAEVAPGAAPPHALGISAAEVASAMGGHANSHGMPLGPSHTLLHASGAPAPVVAPAPIAPDISADLSPDMAPDSAEEPAAAKTLVDDAVPLGTTPSTRSGPSRVSFGTMIGHEMHAVQARVNAAVAEAEAGARGTAHGRDVHLPASPGMLAGHDAAPLAAPGVIPMADPAGVSGSSSSSPSLSPSPTSAPGQAVATVHEQVNEFSGGDHTFFETLPVNDEYEPENPRGRLYTRIAVSAAVLAVVSVVVFAWVNSHSSGEEPAPVGLKTAATPVRPAPAPVVAAPPPHAAPAPAARASEGPPTSTIPSSNPEAEPAIAVAPAAANPVRVAKAQPAASANEPKAPSLAPPAPAEHKPSPPTPAAPKPSVAAAAAPSAKPPVETASQENKEGNKEGNKDRSKERDRDKKPTAVAAKPAEPAHAAPSHPREPAHPAAPAPKVAAAPAARAPHPETPARPVAKPPAPAAARTNQKGLPTKGKAKYDPDGTLPLSFD